MTIDGDAGGGVDAGGDFEVAGGFLAGGGRGSAKRKGRTLGEGWARKTRDEDREH